MFTIAPNYTARNRIMPKVVKTQDQTDTKPYPTTPPPGESSQKGSSPQKSPGKKGVAPWTPQETWALFNALYVKRDAPNWDEVAKAVGRDKKVRQIIYECQN